MGFTHTSRACTSYCIYAFMTTNAVASGGSEPPSIDPNSVAALTTDDPTPYNPCGCRKPALMFAWMGGGEALLRPALSRLCWTSPPRVWCPCPSLFKTNKFERGESR